MDQEIRAPNNQLPPLEDGLALMAIRTEARRFKCALRLGLEQFTWHATALDVLSDSCESRTCAEMHVDCRNLDNSDTEFLSDII